MSEAGLRPRIRTALAPLDRPLTSYYLLLSCTGLLLAIGLMMVLSTSSASQLQGGLPPFAEFLHQLAGALAGLAIMWVASRLPIRVFRVLARPMYIGAIASLLIVLAFGHTVDGAERWIFGVQPSEFAKLAFLIWGADLLARKEQLGQLSDWRSLLIPLLPGAAVIALLVVAGDDLGTTFILLVILLALLWVVGTPTRLFIGLLGLIVFAMLVLIVVANYRSNRLSGFLHPNAGGPTGPNMQEIQGQYALGSGGLFGVGLGHSLQKWGWVPNNSTDFIFSILGEELGLVGTATVVLLYSGIGYAGLRIARRVREPFMRFAATAAVAWIVGQAVINIGGVIHLVPITGVPLPLVSEGLSSMLATLAAIGMLLSFARREPEAQAALALAGPRRTARILATLRGRDVASDATRSPDQTRPPARAKPPRRPRDMPAADRAGRRAGRPPGPHAKGSSSARPAPGSSSSRPAPDTSSPKSAPGRSSARPVPRPQSGQVPVRSGHVGQPGRSRLADPGSRPGQGGPVAGPGRPRQGSSAGRQGSSAGRQSGSAGRQNGSAARQGSQPGRQGAQAAGGRSAQVRQGGWPGQHDSEV